MDHEIPSSTLAAKKCMTMVLGEKDFYQAQWQWMSHARMSIVRSKYDNRHILYAS